jgi:uncharacterized membrane protein (DUF106 family)
MGIRKIKFKNFRRIIEFFIIGVVFGITEDMLAVLIATDAKFSWKILWVVTLVAIPFAIISELIVDRVKFPAIKKWWDKEKKEVKKEMKDKVKDMNKDLKKIKFG